MNAFQTKIPPDVASAISAATVRDGGIDFGPPGSVDKATYGRLKKVLENFGVTWSRKAGLHLPPAGKTPEEALTEMGSPSYTDQRKAFQFFPTVPEVADRMCAALFSGAERSGRLLEPSCGDGALLQAAVRCGFRGSMAGCELDPLRAAAALGGLAPHVGDTLSVSMAAKDFMEVEPVPEFGFVLMNPPFSKGRDWQHVAHAARFLAPGGRLVALVGDGGKTPELLGCAVATIETGIVAGTDTGARSRMVLVTVAAVD